MYAGRAYHAGRPGMAYRTTATRFNGASPRWTGNRNRSGNGHWNGHGNWNGNWRTNGHWSHNGHRFHCNNGVVFVSTYPFWPWWDWGYFDSGYYGYNPYDYYGYGYDYSYGGQDASLATNVQETLARKGYYRGEIDGVLGTRTRSAIRNYERANGLPVDGLIDRQLLHTMGLG